MLSADYVSFIYNTYTNVTPETEIAENEIFIKHILERISDLQLKIASDPINTLEYQEEIDELEENIVDLHSHIDEMRQIIKEFGPNYKLTTHVF